MPILVPLRANHKFFTATIQTSFLPSTCVKYSLRSFAGKSSTNAATTFLLAGTDVKIQSPNHSWKNPRFQQRDVTLRVHLRKLYRYFPYVESRRDRENTVKSSKSTVTPRSFLHSDRLIVRNLLSGMRLHRSHGPERRRGTESLDVFGVDGPKRGSRSRHDTSCVCATGLSDGIFTDRARGIGETRDDKSRPSFANGSLETRITRNRDSRARRARRIYNSTRVWGETRTCR